MTGVDEFAGRRDAMVEEIGRLVRCESPSTDAAAVAEAAALVAELGEQRLGVPPERLDIEGVPHLRWVLGDPAARRRVLLLGHCDTVWPLGTLQENPFRVESAADGDVLRGPGCFDMKAGVVMAMHAVEVLAADGPPDVTLLVTGDEEVGSTTSSGLVQDEARKASAVLVLEASADGGAVKSARKGTSNYDVLVTGRAAHAGLEPEKGVNAALEIAARVLHAATLGDPAAGTTVTPTTVQAGTTTNTVPARASLAVDVRAWTRAEQERVDRAIRAVPVTVDGAAVEVRGGINRPPLEATASVDLLRIARDIHARLGLGELDDRAVGGASDGNFAAGVGTPTLDGLGAVGGGAHADDEHVLVEFLVPRTALLAALVAELTG